VRSKALKWGESSEVLLRKDWDEDDGTILGTIRNGSVEAVTARGANRKRAEALERVYGFTSEIDPEGETPRAGPA